LVIHAIAACNPVFDCIPYGQVVTPRNYPTASPPCTRGWLYPLLVPSSALSPTFHSTSSPHCINPGTNYRCFMGEKTMTAGIPQKSPSGSAISGSLSPSKSCLRAWPNPNCSTTSLTNYPGKAWACTGGVNDEVKRWKNTAYLCEYSIGTKRIFETYMATLVKYNIMLWHLTHCMIPLQSCFRGARAKFHEPPIIFYGTLHFE
ncbi:hypothetical protein N7536_000300, partial [Penicillium majusculum]